MSLPREPTVLESAERIRARNPELCAFVSIRLERALAEYSRLSGEPPRSALHGVPYSLKDTWEVEGEVTTAGSYRHRDRVSASDSPVHRAFRDAGAVLMGKTNLSDLMLMPESSSYVGGICRNPRDIGCTSGGSSGGAAVAVADGMVAFDWGSDVGGSIRTPAAYCGILGLRLSSECWPMVGDFPKLPPSLGWMNGQGPLAGTVKRMRDVLAVAAPVLRTGTVRPFRLRGAMLYCPDRRAEGHWRSFASDVEPVLRQALDGAELRRDHGLIGAVEARNVALSMWASHFEDLLSADVFTLAEGLRAVASSVLFRGRFGDRRLHPHTATVLMLIALGRVTLFRDPRAARAKTLAFRDAVSELWDRGYLLAMPTTVSPPPKHGGSFFDPTVQVYTMPGNVADATSLALPFGSFRNGMPRSVQIMGPPGSEDAVLDVGERVLKCAS